MSDQEGQGLDRWLPRWRAAAARATRVTVDGDAGLHRVWYDRLLAGRWPFFFGVLVAAIVLINLAFACVYWWMPSDLAGYDGSFEQAFAFSVQTFFTIGYGSIAPDGWPSHLVVTLEATVGLLFTAVATGAAFARVSRPNARILFSRVAIFTTMDGVPTFSFRVGNLRGQDVLDAHIRLVALVEHTTREGVKMRRMLELAPERGYSPIFRLTWTILHHLDDRSPLTPLLVDGRPDDRLLGVIALLTAHDVTLGAQLHAQQFYYLHDFRHGVAFRDVLHPQSDGSFSVDYEAFHEVVPVASLSPDAEA